MPPLIHKFFSIPENFGKQKGSYTKLFVSVLWDKKFRQNCDAPPPLLCMKIFDKRVFLKHQSVLQWNILVQWNKNFDWKSRYSPPPLIQTFSIPENIATVKNSPTEIFGTVRQKTFDGNLWYPLLCIKFFDTPNFLSHWRDAHDIFRHCETKNFRRKLVIPPIMHKIFRYPKFSETLEGCPRNFSALWDQKFSTKKRDTPLFIHKTFWNQKFPQKQ